MTTLNAESFEFKAPPAVIRHARNYIAKMPEAIAGEGGHPATFAVACKLVQGFGLKFDDALQLMLEYNVRCVPPWSLPELKHKITDALGLPVDDRGEAYLLKPKRDSQPDALPYVRNRRPFTQEDIFALARLRRIQPHGIKFAAEKGFLFRTNWFGDECFGVTDSAGLLIELRRMDGQPFAALPQYNLAERKSHAVRHSKKTWPLGILEAQEFPSIALVEGVPDFLYAHLRVLVEGARQRVAVVGMLSAAPAIFSDALRYFERRRVRIFPHMDVAGMTAARRWQGQLQMAGAAEVDIFDFTGLVAGDATPINDLCDLTKLTPCELEADATLARILP